MAVQAGGRTTVFVEGLDDLIENAREASAKLESGMDAHMAFVVELVYEPTRQAIMDMVHDPRSRGRLAESATFTIKGGDFAEISVGEGLDYAGWWIFGGNTGRNGSARREYIRRGRVLYHQLGIARPAIQQYSDMLGETLVSVFDR